MVRVRPRGLRVEFLNAYRSIPLVYETVLMGLVLYKAVKLSKELFAPNGSVLIRILIRDQAMYFIGYAPYAPRFIFLLMLTTPKRHHLDYIQNT